VEDRGAAALSPELFTSLGAMLVGIIGAVTSLFLALRKRIAEEDVPALKRKVADLEQLREADRIDYDRDINQCRRDVLMLERALFTVERMVAATGQEVPPRPRLSLAPKDTGTNP
jgi:hypothetical protein